MFRLRSQSTPPTSPLSNVHALDLHGSLMSSRGPRTPRVPDGSRYLVATHRSLRGLAAFLLALSLGLSIWAVMLAHRNTIHGIHGQHKDQVTRVTTYLGGEGRTRRKNGVEEELEALPIPNKVYPSSGNTPYSLFWENTIAICAIMKDERPEDVLEWMDYHRHIGVDRIYLRENNNGTTLLRYLEPYIKEGFLDYGFKDGPKHPTQTNWFNECGMRANSFFSWLAFVDMDEFIVVLDKQQSVTEAGALKKVLRSRFRYTGAVSLQWVLFGSGGHVQKPTSGQLASYDRCTGMLSKQMKCIGNLYWTYPDVIFRPLHVHQCTLQPGVAAVLGNGLPLSLQEVEVKSNPGQAVSYAGHLQGNMDFHSIITDEHSIVLFHYVTRSFEEFMNRKIRNRSGQYASEFKETLSQVGVTEADMIEKFKDFETKNLFDGDSPICHQGRALRASFKVNYHDTPEQAEPAAVVPADAAEALIAEWVASAAISDPGRPFDDTDDDAVDGEPSESADLSQHAGCTRAFSGGSNSSNAALCSAVARQ